jgi:hypothetical protein
MEVSPPNDRKAKSGENYNSCTNITLPIEILGLKRSVETVEKVVIDAVCDCHKSHLWYIWSAVEMT